MTKLIAHNGFIVDGELYGFERGGEEVFLKFKPNITITITPPHSLVMTMEQLGLFVLQKATINMITNKIELTKK